MAGAFTNQPRSTPITNQQQATQLGQGNFSSMQQQQFGNPQMQGFGGQPGGMNGNIYPLGQQFGHTTIYAVVESGQPIIIDPKTGEKYPPGYIPTIQDPNTWEQWQPGQSWAETMELANAEFSEGMRQAVETLVRPGEEAAAETAQGFLKDLSGAANKWTGQASQNLYGKDNKTLKDIQSRASQAGKQVINQAPQVAQQAIKQAPQIARQAGQAASQVTGQATKFFSGSGSAAPAASGGAMRSALTSVAGERAFVSGTRRN
ncbi:MAG: hypothetical protein JGK17_06205 [Microcoleus sp. PH2017_10_PVI_O_A]|uniref:hypothetical protein n=1 Tax=unclassified Microcoleus TaxID=2642155 RepID=UPI001E15F2D2|nr:MULTISPECIES: hypothetical protein [unclassified Microcoleus]TAE84474.1 MAG: hypothetical protein EAZ83_05820 [Oscillatoriales cyanobacterium]MCC3405179.1 hypothetical protein [Microcoleus sp. PH2017_10_PVI_O_A]MCC3459266.1 hypothetical protein [Microcoleus sp. PH2017_11_PCY_U_A]MCC3477419.1 hypothetical protein [Microcoleus sp. PH2017_12_PCY_D_A]MCC3558512.1 hypothetical protein [Microcoleus sp. PH2017_27_LUM_O_A]